MITAKILIEAGSKGLSTSPYERYVIAQSEEVENGQITKHVARTLHDLGLIDSPESVGLPYEEVGGALAL